MSLYVKDQNMIRRTITCPCCEKNMEVRGRHGVAIDVCPHCRGVWLDKGELDQVLERSGRFLEIPGEDPEDRSSNRRRYDFFPKGFAAQ